MTKFLILLLGGLLAFAGGRAEAALFGGGEAKAYTSALESYRLQMWERAEKELAEFVKDYPKSEHVIEAVRFQAEAQFEQHKYDAMMALLLPRLGAAGELADQYLYWLGQAQMNSSNFLAAATSFGKLGQEHPTSPKRLEAAIAEAAALARLDRLEQWTNVVTLLERTNGSFRQAKLSAHADGELVGRGYLLLAEAQLKLKDFPSVAVALSKVGTNLPPDLEWKRRNFLCQMYAGMGQADKAVVESAGMIAAAEKAVSNPDRLGLIADSVVFRAELLEQLGQKNEALATWSRNLTNPPVARQRQALLRITALAMQGNQLATATRTLETYLEQFTNSPAADVAWLTLGELHLKQQVGGQAGTNAIGEAVNHLAVAQECFQKVIKNYPGSAYVGKAQLDLGWSYWLEKNYLESSMVFGAAVKRLPLSQDRAVAQYKLADAQFTLRNFSEALANYTGVLQVATNWPVLDAVLKTPASYQALRASLELTNAAGAEQAMRGILTSAPASAEAVGSILLVAQAYVDAELPLEAQRLFGEFILQYPNSELRPEVELLVARMREEQGDWPKVAAAYDAWLANYPTNRLRAQVEFQRALAAAGANEEAQALQRFTNFIATHPTSDLAPRAQWWVADWYFQHRNFQSAEINYKQLFNTWSNSPLAYEARMMAGQAALGLTGYQSAVDHFISLHNDTNGPPELRMQALLAYGGALKLWPPAATETNKLANFARARQVFESFTQLYPSNQLAAVAFGEIGDCSLQLATADPTYYNAALDAYQRVITFPGASGAARNQAKVALAGVLEKQGLLAGGGAQTNFWKQARELYRDVYLEKAEPSDLFWKKKAGIEAARLSSELLNEWPQALELYRDMLRQKLFAPDLLASKIDSVEKRLHQPE